jgi:hypothetical protein
MGTETATTSSYFSTANQQRMQIIHGSTGGPLGSISLAELFGFDANGQPYWANSGIWSDPASGVHANLPVNAFSGGRCPTCAPIAQSPTSSILGNISVNTNASYNSTVVSTTMTQPMFFDLLLATFTRE